MVNTELPANTSLSTPGKHPAPEGQLTFPLLGGRGVAPPEVASMLCPQHWPLASWMGKPATERTGTTSVAPTQPAHTQPALSTGWQRLHPRTRLTWQCKCTRSQICLCQWADRGLRYSNGTCASYSSSLVTREDICLTCKQAAGRRKYCIFSSISFCRISQAIVFSKCNTKGKPNLWEEEAFEEQWKDYPVQQSEPQTTWENSMWSFVKLKRLRQFSGSSWYKCLCHGCFSLLSLPSFSLQFKIPTHNWVWSNMLLSNQRWCNLPTGLHLVLYSNAVSEVHQN